MYKISSVLIEGFWGRCSARCSFNKDVNIIIGRNGTGKTTFMNILDTVLSVDLNGLADSEFHSVVIHLKKGGGTRKISVTKIEDVERFRFFTFQYKIGNKKYILRTPFADDRYISMSIRKRFIEESSEVRDVLRELVSLSTLSVYRLRSNPDSEIVDKRGKTYLSPVDLRINQIAQDLAVYQLELSQQSSVVSGELQKSVLTSILYSGKEESQKIIPVDFDIKVEKRRLISAFRRLDCLDDSVKEAIEKHISHVKIAVEKIFDDDSEVKSEDISALDSFWNTQKLVELSLEAEGKINKVYNPVRKFMSVLSGFIQDKNFSFESGDLRIDSQSGENINLEKLSSGEKQLIIILAEALLQRAKSFVYLTDEPELSLHIEWQRNIIPAIRELNPNAQIIAATHSPEVASKYSHAITNMREVVDA